MKVDLMTGGLPLRDMQQLARDASASGFSGLVITEAGRTAYLSCAAAALAAEIDLLSGIAVAFPRSPMVTAAVAWELADVSSGRFRLGLGTQVRAHVERRYGSEFDPPGPRMRDYVGALRAIFAAYRGTDHLDHDGV
jgi:alkanesulfonate monooxygenase SsuD/methylene tetrahydromethanopterin reductase-like flavin-dependent oxidoreductase (luciferase family)